MGTNVYGALLLMAEGGDKAGSVVSMICDLGGRFLETCYNLAWLTGQGLDIEPYLQQLDSLEKTGKLEAVDS